MPKKLFHGMSELRRRAAEHGTSTGTQENYKRYPWYGIGPVKPKTKKELKRLQKTLTEFKMQID